MTRFIFASIVSLILCTACGLNYVPPETMENNSVQRKEAIEAYIGKSFKDSTASYHTISFGETTVVKPTNYKLLDSLYLLKYTNERQGSFDPELEEKINIQRNIIATDTNKVKYIEHHIYGISNDLETEIDYVDVTIYSNLTITDFQITNQYHIPTALLNEFKTYINQESILYPGYLPSGLDRDFYDMFSARFNELPLAEQNEFLVHTLKIMDLGGRLQTMEKQILLKELAVLQVELRKYNVETDIFQSVDGVYENSLLIEYILKFTSPSGSYMVKYSPYLELKSIEFL